MPKRVAIVPPACQSPLYTKLGETWVFNPGRQIGPHPTRILFDSEAGTALWLSLAGAAIVDLNAPLSRPLSEPADMPLWIR